VLMISYFQFTVIIQLLLILEVFL